MRPIRLALMGLAALVAACAISYKPETGWVRVRAVHIETVLERPIRNCAAIPDGPALVTDGTTPCPVEADVGLRRSSENLVKRLALSPGSLQGVTIVLTRDRVWCGGELADGCANARARMAIVHNIAMWPTLCHELAHLAGEDHPLGPIDNLTGAWWRFIERCYVD